MAEYQKQTDEAQVVTLESKIIQVFWGSRLAMQDEKIEFEVWTQFVGNQSKIEIKVEDKKGKKVAKTKGQVFNNQFRGAIIVTKKAKESITFTAKLPDHGLEMKSASAIVIPAIEVTNQKWSEKEARRGDVVTLTADVEGLPDDTEVMIHIYEYDQDGAHDFIAKFPTNIKDNKIEVEWAYEYHEDTDEIPTDEEKKKYGGKYNPPEYFWMIEIGNKRFGEKQESSLLIFKDWFEVRFTDVEGQPIADEEYKANLPDGSEKKGKTDKQGYIIIKDVNPGKMRVELGNDDKDEKKLLEESYEEQEEDKALTSKEKASTEEVSETQTPKPNTTQATMKQNGVETLGKDDKPEDDTDDDEDLEAEERLQARFDDESDKIFSMTANIP